MISQLTSLYTRFYSGLEALITPLLLLFVRIWAAKAFLQSGLVKIQSWDSTLYLFEEEYQVPILPWEMAAYLGTAVELILPPLLILGLLSRGTASVLFVFNIIAVISYPAIWDGGFYDHQLWGLMFLMTAVFGPGALSVDHLLKKRFAKSN
ncbi:DoxX family protein [Oceanospirillum sediminis]|uniref:DoxX family protein n=1 Tax=Oceanospirillum sediminis TaxID=2760088 RepID=A0A839IP03_9GAMM|nr:DoxX family protein [Oceanospirillum sediminis]MBB1485996.1 DoxX family protein [Oceanospirillum sediminis]